MNWRHGGEGRGLDIRRLCIWLRKTYFDCHFLLWLLLLRERLIGTDVGVVKRECFYRRGEYAKTVAGHTTQIWILCKKWQIAQQTNLKIIFFYLLKRKGTEIQCHQQGSRFNWKARWSTYILEQQLGRKVASCQLVQSVPGEQRRWGMSDFCCSISIKSRWIRWLFSRAYIYYLVNDGLIVMHLKVNDQIYYVSTF